MIFQHAYPVRDRVSKCKMANRLLRQYFWKRTDLSEDSQAELNRIARRLNPRPRKTLGYKTPADKLDAALR